jgi:hypothetical protein
MSRKAQFAEFWLEYVAGALLILGFYLAARGAYLGVVHITAFLIGALLGKFWYDCFRKRTTRIYIAILTLAVLLGMLIGSFGADRRLVVLLYAAGLALGYAAHHGRWIKTE